MVVPTTYHAPLTTWLNAREPRCAHELGGTVVLRGYGPLAGLIKPEHLTEEVLGLFHFARSAPRMAAVQAATVHAAREMLREPVTAALQSICDDLAAQGIEAEPHEGLGVLSGDEIFGCEINIGSPVRLAETLGVPYTPTSFD